MDFQFTLSPPKIPDSCPVNAFEDFVTKSVVIDGLPQALTEEDVVQVFMQYGKPNSIWRSKGANGKFCLEFCDNKCAREAKKLNGYLISIENPFQYSSYISVEFAYNDEQSQKPLIPYTRQAINIVESQLSSLISHREGVETLNDWLKKGQVHASNAIRIYSLFEIGTHTIFELIKQQKVADNVEKSTHINSEAFNKIEAHLNSLDLIYNNSNFFPFAELLNKDEKTNLMQFKQAFEKTAEEFRDERAMKRKREDIVRAASKRCCIKEILKLDAEKEDLELQLNSANQQMESERLDLQRERYFMFNFLHQIQNSHLVEKEDLELQLATANEQLEIERSESQREKGLLTSVIQALRTQVDKLQNSDSDKSSDEISCVSSTEVSDEEPTKYFADEGPD